MTELAENLERLEETIADACRAAGRARGEVELMAVSKTFPAESIVEAAALGLRLFGENRVQEFAVKAPALALRAATSGGADAGLHAADFSMKDVKVHLIGHLQSNKSARAVELFDGIDSLDSVRRAERLNAAAGECSKRLPVLIEVKLSAEEDEGGR